MDASAKTPFPQSAKVAAAFAFVGAALLAVLALQSRPAAEQRTGASCFTCPPMNPPVDLEAPRNYPLVGIHLDPPATESPPVSPTEALAVAWAHVGGELVNDATDVTPVHALFPAAGDVAEDMDLWDMRFHGGCIPKYGPAPDPGQPTTVPTCEPVPILHVFVNATTGGWIATFGTES